MVGERDLAAARAAPPQPLVLGHQADDRGQLPDLMADRLADRLAVGELLAAALATLRRMLDRRVRVNDHLTMTALMPGLAAGLAPRALTHRALGRLRRI